MAGHDTLAQRLLQGFNRIALAKIAEWRRQFLRALAIAAHRMARCAVSRQQLFATFEILCNGGLPSNHERREQRTGNQFDLETGRQSARDASADTRLASAAQTAAFYIDIIGH